MFISADIRDNVSSENVSHTESKCVCIVLKKFDIEK